MKNFFLLIILVSAGIYFWVKHETDAIQARESRLTEIALNLKDNHATDSAVSVQWYDNSCGNFRSQNSVSINPTPNSGYVLKAKESY